MPAPITDLDETLKAIGNLTYATNDAVKQLMDRVRELEARVKFLEESPLQKGG